MMMRRRRHWKVSEAFYAKVKIEQQNSSIIL